MVISRHAIVIGSLALSPILRARIEKLKASKRGELKAMPLSGRSAQDHGGLIPMETLEILQQAQIEAALAEAALRKAIAEKALAKMTAPPLAVRAVDALFRGRVRRPLDAPCVRMTTARPGKRIGALLARDARPRGGDGRSSGSRYGGALPFRLRRWLCWRALLQDVSQ
jgi:hypothetical protein